MTARIYKPAKTAMQSGQGKTRDWVLDYEPEEPRVVESLMGWTSSGDMKGQLRLRFDTKEEAAFRIRYSRPSPPPAAAWPMPTISPSTGAAPGRTDRRGGPISVSARSCGHLSDP